MSTNKVAAKILRAARTAQWFYIIAGDGCAAESAGDLAGWLKMLRGYRANGWEFDVYTAGVYVSNNSPHAVIAVNRNMSGYSLIPFVEAMRDDFPHMVGELESEIDPEDRDEEMRFLGGDCKWYQESQDWLLGYEKIGA